MKPTLIFDLDGTLLNTLEDLKDSTNYAMRLHGFPERTLEEIRKFVGNGLGMLIRRASPAGTDDAVLCEVLADMKAHYTTNYHNKTAPYAGIPELLEQLKADSYPMAIVSNKADSVVSLLRKLYFPNLIPVAVGETSTIARKPAPDMVQEAERRLDAVGAPAIYIGDSEVDIQTGRNAAIPCLSVCWGFRSRAQLEDAGAKYIFSTPNELYLGIQNKIWNK